MQQQTVPYSEQSSIVFIVSICNRKELINWEEIAFHCRVVCEHLSHSPQSRFHFDLLFRPTLDKLITILVVFNAHVGSISCSYLQTRAVYLSWLINFVETVVEMHGCHLALTHCRAQTLFHHGW